MKFSIGDKVSFINEKLNGVITVIVNDRICKVEIDDGFEIDADMNELVKISSGGQAKSMPEKIPQAVEEITERKFADLDDGMIAFISLPSEESKVLTGNIRFYLVNHSAFDLHYLVLAETSQGFLKFSDGVLDTQSEILLADVSRTELFDFSHFTIQLLFSKKDQPFDWRKPMSRDLPVLLPDLQNASNEKGLRAFARVFEIVSLKDMTEPAKTEIKDLVQKFATAPTPASAKKSMDTFPQGRGILLNEKEVDLHIEELITDHRQLSNAEIISIQLQRFRKELDLAMLNHFNRIIFIHGVGNGRLRNEIHSELKDIPGIRFREADFEKYGSGATEVILK